MGFIQKVVASNTSYKFRAETQVDVARMLMKVAIRSMKIDASFAPDCVVTFTSPQSLEEIKKFMLQIPDSHVMVETLNIESKYTGNRGH